MVTRARGTFDVTVKPLPADAGPGVESLGRLSIEKKFSGDIEGTSKGQMLTGGTAIKNSAAYVAIEQVSGSLKGRKGTFILQHTGVMNRGEGSLVITVVPDSGTGSLEGLTGTMVIKVDAGNHSYEMEYSLGNT
ncbi:MAG: DUF3224 domain-containing protein [Gemmatimonadales bacterium]